MRRMFSVRSSREKPRSRHRPVAHDVAVEHLDVLDAGERSRPATSPATVLLPDRGRPVSHSVKPLVLHVKREP